MIDYYKNTTRLTAILQAAVTGSPLDLGPARTREEVFVSRALGLRMWAPIPPELPMEWYCALLAGDLSGVTLSELPAPRTAAESYALRYCYAMSGALCPLPVFTAHSPYEICLAMLSGVLPRDFGTPGTEWETLLRRLAGIVSPAADQTIFTIPGPVWAAGSGLNKMPATLNTVCTDDGVSVLSAGGRYYFSGTATRQLTIDIPFPEPFRLTIPDHTIQFHNTRAVSGITCGFCRDGERIMYWSMNPANRVVVGGARDELIDTLRITVSPNTKTNGMIISPQWMEGSVSDPIPFTPYSTEAAGAVYLGQGNWMVIGDEDQTPISLYFPAIADKAATEMIRLRNSAPGWGIKISTDTVNLDKAAAPVDYSAKASVGQEADPVYIILIPPAGGGVMYFQGSYLTEVST